MKRRRRRGGGRPAQPPFAVLEVPHHKGPLPPRAVGEQLLATGGTLS